MDIRPDNVILLVVGIVRRNGDVLMVKQAGPDEEPYWILPGGRVEPDEPILEAMAREVLEETGILVTHPELLCVKQVLRTGPDVEYIVFFFRCDPASPDSTPNPQDPDDLVLEAAFVPVAAAVGHIEEVFGPDEPTAAYLAGRDIESITTVRQEA
jgi:8-oxo-dGTP diphosphatase